MTFICEIVVNGFMEIKVVVVNLWSYASLVYLLECCSSLRSLVGKR